MIETTTPMQLRESIASDQLDAAQEVYAFCRDEADYAQAHDLPVRYMDLDAAWARVAFWQAQ